MKKICDWLQSRKRSHCAVKQVINGTLTRGFESGVVACVNELVGSPKVGAEYYNRVGNRIHMMKLLLTGLVSPTYNNGNEYLETQAILAVVFDRQPNGSIPMLNEIFHAFTNNGVGVYGAVGIDLRNADRFSLLYFKFMGFPQIGINGVHTTATDPQRFVDIDKKVIDVEIDLTGLEGFYGGGTDGNSDNVRSGQLLLITWQHVNTALNGPAYEIRYGASLYFEDL